MPQEKLAMTCYTSNSSTGHMLQVSKPSTLSAEKNPTYRSTHFTNKSLEHHTVKAKKKTKKETISLCSTQNDVYNFITNTSNSLHVEWEWKMEVTQPKWATVIIILSASKWCVLLHPPNTSFCGAPNSKIPHLYKLPELYNVSSPNSLLEFHVLNSSCLQLQVFLRGNTFPSQA